MGVGYGDQLVLIDLQADFLRQLAAVGEQERCPVAGDSLLEAGRQRPPNALAVRRRSADFLRKEHAQVDLLACLAGPSAPTRPAAVHNNDAPGGAVRTPTADVGGHRVERTDGGGQGDALQFAGQALQALQGHHELNPAAIVHQGVDLIDNDRLQGRQGGPPAGGGQQQQQAFRGGDENVRRLPQHPLALALRRVAGAGLHSQAGKSAAFPQFAQGRQKIALNIVVQRLEGRHIQHPRATGAPNAGRKLVQRPEKRRQRLAAAGRRRGQHMRPGGDARPSLGLNFRGRGKAAGKPSPQRRVKWFERVHAGNLEPRAP